MDENWPVRDNGVAVVDGAVAVAPGFFVFVPRTTNQ